MVRDDRGRDHRPPGQPDGGQFPSKANSRPAGSLGPAPDEPIDPVLESVLESAAELQRRVPDAVLVGGTAAAYYARHRLSYDHDHVLTDLRDRFDLVLEALDRDGFVLNRATPGKIILGELGGIEAGVRQLIRRKPLETQEVILPSGSRLVVPTLDETARVKSYLIVRRNQVRDYLDVAALSDRYGADVIANGLSDIDAYYADPDRDPAPAVLTQLLSQLADPQPKDSRTTGRLSDYKGLASRWQDWDEVRAECQRLASEIVEGAA